MLAVGWGGWVALRFGYVLIKDAQITDWHVKTVLVDGLQGKVEKQVFETAASLEGKPFSFEQAQQLQRKLQKQYPMLKRVQVSRGLLTGKLRITAKPREPVAQFVLPDASRPYVDQDGTVYTDDEGPQDIPQVELMGEIPTTLPSSFVELAQGVVRLKKLLPFVSMKFNVPENTIVMYLPDESEVHFGGVQDLKSKVQRAAQIMNIAREKYSVPVVLDFKFFTQGKVFLTLSAH